MQGRAARLRSILEYAPPLAGDIARRAFDTAAAIARASTLEELDRAIHPTLELIGFTHFVVVDARATGIRRIAGAQHPTWWPHMFAKGYDKVDAPFVAASRGGGAQFYAEVSALSDLSPLQARIQGERQEFGIQEGYINTLHSRDGTGIVVAMVGERIDVLDPDVRATAQILSSYYGLAANRLWTPPPATAIAPIAPQANPPVALTARQLDCLRWVREGKSGTDIAEILGISMHTVHEHVAQACARLGVRTRIQAVAAALCLGLIDP